MGTFDGEQFTLTQVPARADACRRRSPTPSPALARSRPGAGWSPTPRCATQEAFDSPRPMPPPSPDDAGLWIDQLQDPAGESGLDPATFVLNVTFTGDLARHEAALRDLRRPFVRERGGEAGRRTGGHRRRAARWCSTPPRPRPPGSTPGGVPRTPPTCVRNVVVATVFAVTGDGQAWVDARYGAGAVVLSSMLSAVEVP